MPRRKKQSFLNKVGRAINPTTPLKKFLLFIAAFAVIGGGYYLYKTHALTGAEPPSALRQIISISPSNGQQEFKCLNTYVVTNFGPLIHNCRQARESLGICSTFAIGTYSPVKDKFSANYPYVGACASISLAHCNNFSATTYFSGLGVASGYGNLFFGYAYRLYGSGWVVNPATYSVEAKSCTLTGSWLEARQYR